MSAGVIELIEDDETSYFEHITAMCTAKEVSKTFAGWVLDPLVEDADLKCIPSGFCNVFKGKPPIPVEEDDKKVYFAPFDNFLEEPLTKFGPVEVGGHMFAYCKGSGNNFYQFLYAKDQYQGYVFDPSAVLLDSGDPATKLLAICSPRVIDGVFPGWRWAPLNTKTGKVEQAYQPWNTSIPTFRT